MEKTNEKDQTLLHPIDPNAAALALAALAKTSHSSVGGKLVFGQVTSFSSTVRTAQPPPNLASSDKRSTQYWLDSILTQDAHMIEQKRLAAIYAPRSEPVLICGPTGTGKESFARAMHGSRHGRFVAVNCGGFPEQLVDSMLFGHRQGAFTGASQDTTGLFAAAVNGTIFLDEIAELPFLMQVKLLRVIQEHEFMRIGDTSVTPTNARVVCATNRNLDREVEERRFREDLYWRVTTLLLRTTALNERLGDVLLYLESQDLRMSDTANLNFERGNYRQLQQWITRHKLSLNL